MITKIELENFKSYYGKKVIGPLHKNFTAVVGPNGSGKSNCIESLLFVFGKRAKQMRLNKLSELIHKSAAFPNCTEATVRVHFTEIIDEWRDPDAYTEVPDTQFTVSRLVTRASTSKYYLNRQMVDYKDVC
jgi:structural maintenance of chromosome 4